MKDTFAKHKNEKKLRGMIKGRQLEPYIEYIRFPRYKRFSPDLRINFTFPLTALVGTNGTGKSSIIRALYGAPKGKSLGNLWFSTIVDPIDEKESERSCFIYGYYNQSIDTVVEVLKTRVFSKKDKDPDYWEPSRPIAEYGMQLLDDMNDNVSGRSQTRWNAIAKNVIYLDFRQALSAYDKFLYYDESHEKRNVYREKKVKIRRMSRHLEEALKMVHQSQKYRNIEKISDHINRVLSNEEVQIVSYILGKNYEKIQIIRHRFYGCDAYTCKMQYGGLNYSEAFAGSGEFSVIRIVSELYIAPEKSLILLDEPEVSLHPGAQSKLMEFLLTAIEKGGHQIVLSTHSPAIVRAIPADAVKLLSHNPDNTVSLTKQSTVAKEAFYYLGEPLENGITILVEDKLAREIIMKALRLCNDAMMEYFTVEYFPGGAESLWGNYARIYSCEKRKNVFIVFDGDKYYKKIRKSSSIPESKNKFLGNEIKEITGFSIKFPVDGGLDGGNTSQLIQIQRDFIDWSRIHVRFLCEMKTPEEFIWKNMKRDAATDCVDGNPEEISFKEKFELLTRILLGKGNKENVDSSEILTIQKMRLSTIEDNNVAIQSIVKRLNRLYENSETC